MPQTLGKGPGAIWSKSKQSGPTPPSLKSLSRPLDIWEQTRQRETQMQKHYKIENDKMPPISLEISVEGSAGKIGVFNTTSKANFTNPSDEANLYSFRDVDGAPENVRAKFIKAGQFDTPEAYGQTSPK